MEFKDWVTDYTKSRIQRISDDEVSILVKDSETMVPQQAHKWIDWDQTRKEERTWPTKTMVSMWFKNETNFVTIFELLKGIDKELEKATYKIHQRKSLTKAHALFFKGLKEMKGEESKVKTIYGKTSNFFFYVGKEVAATYTREGEGHAEEGWIITLQVVSAICTDFGDALFETMVKSS